MSRAGELLRAYAAEVAVEVRTTGNGDGSITMRCTRCGDGLPAARSTDLDDLLTRWAGHLERRHSGPDGD